MQVKLESYNYLSSKDGTAKDIVLYMEQIDGDNQTFAMSRAEMATFRKMCGEIKIDAAHTAADAISHITAVCRVVPLEHGVEVRKWEIVVTFRNISEQYNAEYVFGRVLEYFQLE